MIFKRKGKNTQFLKEKRNHLGFTLQKLGELIGKSGSAIGFWENGDNQIPEEMIEPLEKALVMTNEDKHSFKLFRNAVAAAHRSGNGKSKRKVRKRRKRNTNSANEPSSLSTKSSSGKVMIDKKMVQKMAKIITAAGGELELDLLLQIVGVKK